MGKFNLKLDTAKKVLNIELEGTFSPEDGEASIKAYKQTISPINPAEYVIHADCRKLNVSAPEMMPLLEGCYVMFKKDGFQQLRITIEENTILKMQLSRLARKSGFDHCEIITTAKV